MKTKFMEPTLILDKEKCWNNIENMAKKASKNNLIFRPHFKTHQSAIIGNWFKNFGVEKITVSSVKMAQYFATKGWHNITVAFPVNINEISRIEDLAQNITLNLLTADVETIEFLAKESENEVNIFFEIDTGDHRSGFECDDYDSMQKGLNIIRGSNNLKLAGLLTHAGQTYSA